VHLIKFLIKFPPRSRVMMPSSRMNSDDALGTWSDVVISNDAAGDDAPISAQLRQLDFNEC